MSSYDKSYTMFILYVENQEKTKEFYKKILGDEPILHVPGMTEFKLSKGVGLGIMPEEGIRKILDDKITNPSEGKGIPRCEIYLYVDNPDEAYTRLIEAGGKGISINKLRAWGDFVAYGADLDGHIIAFARKHE